MPGRIKLARTRSNGVHSVTERVTPSGGDKTPLTVSLVSARTLRHHSNSNKTTIKPTNGCTSRLLLVNVFFFHAIHQPVKAVLWCLGVRTLFQRFLLPLHSLAIEIHSFALHAANSIAAGVSHTHCATILLLYR